MIPAVLWGVSYDSCSTLGISYNSCSILLWERQKCLSIIYINFTVQMDKETECTMMLQHKYLNSSFTMGHIWTQPIKFRWKTNSRPHQTFFIHSGIIVDEVNRHLIQKQHTSQQNTDNKSLKVRATCYHTPCIPLVGTMAIPCKVCGIR